MGWAGIRQAMLQGLETEEYLSFRSLTIAMVLATDAKTHFSILSEVQVRRRVGKKIN